MDLQMQHRVNTIERKRGEKDQKIQEVIHRRQHEMLIQKERDNMLRQTRQDTVQRIMRANEYHKYKILLKIEEDNDRCGNLRD